MTRVGGAMFSAVVMLTTCVVAAAAQSDGWQIGDDALDLTNPVPVSSDVLERGRDLYGQKCRRCHGQTGRGNGPDADFEHPPRDLTDASRAARNPDGVLFYKIWNGRSNPRMPAFKAELTQTDVWTVVHFIKTLRTP